MEFVPDKHYFRALIITNHLNKMSNLFSKLNARLLVIHFVALWFIIYGFQTLAFLYDFNFMFLSSQESRFGDLGRMHTDIKVITLISFLGAIIGYIISWRTSVNRNWFWLNSVIVFVVIYVLELYNRLGFHVLQKLVMFPGTIFGLNTRTYYVSNGLIMLAIGSFLLFSGRIKRFIDKGGIEEKKAKTIIKAKPAKS